MNLNDFKAGTYIQQYKYKSFSPEKINHTWVWTEPEINTLLEEATRALGELNGLASIVPDIDLFIQMHIIKEANTSSRIEGTKTGIDEDLMRKEEIAPEKRDDWQEVQNYVHAMNYAIDKLKDLPISSRLLQHLHLILLEGVRGEHKSRGEFCRSQNWIGGSSLSDAVFIPPHHEDVPGLMSDFEHFLHNEEIHVPHLIKIALAHYQFETIHPFCDGNGRIGRLLITLYLVSNGLLSKPSLYLSAFFEKNRASYYDALSRVRASNDLIHWVKFFLNAVIVTAKKGKVTFSSIFALKNEIDGRIINLNRKAPKSRRLMNLLYSKPVITVSDVEQYLAISTPTANEYIKTFTKLNILVEMTGKSRYRHFMFQEYLNLFMD
ncbi:MAG: Fic family protein [Elusimicrobiota bacterium]